MTSDCSSIRFCTADCETVVSLTPERAITRTGLFSDFNVSADPVHGFTHAIDRGFAQFADLAYQSVRRARRQIHVIRRSSGLLLVLLHLQHLLQCTIARASQCQIGGHRADAPELRIPDRTRGYCDLPAGPAPAESAPDAATAIQPCSRAPPLQAPGSRCCGPPAAVGLPPARSRPATPAPTRRVRRSATGSGPLRTRGRDAARAPAPTAPGTGNRGSSRPIGQCGRRSALHDPRAPIPASEAVHGRRRHQAAAVRRALHSRLGRRPGVRPCSFRSTAASPLRARRPAGRAHRQPAPDAQDAPSDYTHVRWMSAASRWPRARRRCCASARLSPDGRHGPRRNIRPGRSAARTLARLYAAAAADRHGAARGCALRSARR